MKTCILRGILQRRKRFILKNRMNPDVLVLTDKAYKKISAELGAGFNGEKLLGMDIEFGDRVAVKLKPTLLLEY